MDNPEPEVTLLNSNGFFSPVFAWYFASTHIISLITTISVLLCENNLYHSRTVLIYGSINATIFCFFLLTYYSSTTTGSRKMFSHCSTTIYQPGDGVNYIKLMCLTYVLAITIYTTLFIMISGASYLLHYPVVLTGILILLIVNLIVPSLIIGSFVIVYSVVFILCCLVSVWWFFCCCCPGHAYIHNQIFGHHEQREKHEQLNHLQHEQYKNYQSMDTLVTDVNVPIMDIDYNKSDTLEEGEIDTVEN